MAFGLHHKQPSALHNQLPPLGAAPTCNVQHSAVSVASIGGVAGQSGNSSSKAKQRLLKLCPLLFLLLLLLLLLLVTRVVVICFVLATRCDATIKPITNAWQQQRYHCHCHCHCHCHRPCSCACPFTAATATCHSLSTRYLSGNPLRLSCCSSFCFFCSLVLFYV